MLALGRRPHTQPQEIVESLESNLLALLFHGVEEGQRLRVLDIGGGCPETVAFLSRFRCRLHCADLFDEPELLTPCGDENNAIRVNALRHTLGITAGDRYDICLFWDLFHYLEPSVLRLFGAALAPAITDTTLAHGFLWHGRGQASRTASPSPRRYGILSGSRMSLKSCQRGLPAIWAHSQRGAGESLGCFRVDKSRLLQGGLLEVVFQGSRAEE